MSFNAAHLGYSHSVKAPVWKSRPVECWKSAGSEQVLGCEAHGPHLPVMEVQNEDAADPGRHMVIYAGSETRKTVQCMDRWRSTGPEHNLSQHPR